jgi:hypothetical protein
MKRLFCLLLLLLFQVSLYAGQERYELETAYFHDKHQKHTIETIIDQPFVPYLGQLRKGFIGGETWIRIQLKTPQSQRPVGPDSPLVLRVEPYSLERLDFHQNNRGHWTRQQAGELQLQKKRICIELQHCFEFSATNAESNFAYLKVETSGARIVRADVMAPDDMQKSSISALKSINTALSLSIALLILSIAFFCLERTRLLLVFCGFQAAVVFSICAYSGVLPTWWGVVVAVKPSAMAGLAQAMRVVMTIVLAWAVLLNYKPSELYNKHVLAALLLCGLNVVLLLIGHETAAAILNYGVCLVSPFIQIWGARTITKPMPGRWIFITGWLFFLFIVVFGFPYGFGYRPAVTCV